MAYDEIKAISCVYTKYTGVHLQCMLTKLHKKTINLKKNHIIIKYLHNIKSRRYEKHVN